MCAPAVMGLMAAGSLFQAAGQMQQGQAAKSAADYNVALGELQARQTMEASAEEEQQLAQQFLRERGAGRSQIGASGVRLDSGSSLDWENDLIETFVSDRSSLKEGTAIQVANIRNQQRLDKAQGASAYRAGQIGAAGSLLSGAGQVANIWYQPK